ncbi:hypothetical protein ACFSO0_09220 [Brevibacillus sp. GCM10020057]|uniref:hypothetical protein n=1 Tax=Brevibacillus sp. GCM10020057 TaxID=3317327 RepID=UPI00363A949B
MLVLDHRHLTLLALSEEPACAVRTELAACGIRLLSAGERAGAGIARVDGLLLTEQTDPHEWERAVPMLAASPGVLLLYGAGVPYGWSATVASQSVGQAQWEVVRLALLSAGEKALIGGEPNGRWVRTLCRLLADRGRVSLVCRMREVDEAVRQLPRFLAWKERFYLELGEVCDREGVSLQTVARAMGMDVRVGQAWLFPERTDHKPLCDWIEREAGLALEKTNGHRVALWGPPSLWQEMGTSWLQGKEVWLVTGEEEPVPNAIFSGWTTCSSWQKALQGADLLVIGKAEGGICELPLQELVRCMRQTVVVDACACFPVQEARSLLQGYRAVGEKTNVWE